MVELAVFDELNELFGLVKHWVLGKFQQKLDHASFSLLHKHRVIFGDLIPERLLRDGRDDALREP